MLELGKSHSPHQPREVVVYRVPLPSPRSSKMTIRERGVGGRCNEVSSKERERRLTEQRVDRSHRRRGGIRGRRRPPPWRRGNKDELVLSLALIFASVILVVVPFVLPT
jgi:hypothetical protein